VELEPSFVRQLTDYGRAGIHHKGTSECASKETLLVAHPWGAKTPNLTTTKSPDGDFSWWSWGDSHPRPENNHLDHLHI